MMGGGKIHVVFTVVRAHFLVKRLATNVAINFYNSSAVNKHRWEQWLWTCVATLLPLPLWLFLVQVIGVERDAGAAEASRELLFFSLAVSTLALSDLRYVEAASRNRKGYETLNSVSLLVILGSVALYGAFWWSTASQQR